MAETQPVTVPDAREYGALVAFSDGEAFTITWLREAVRRADASAAHALGPGTRYEVRLANQGTPSYSLVAWYRCWLFDSDQTWMDTAETLADPLIYKQDGSCVVVARRTTPREGTHG